MREMICSRGADKKARKDEREGTSGRHTVIRTVVLKSRVVMVMVLKAAMGATNTERGAVADSRVPPAVWELRLSHLKPRKVRFVINCLRQESALTLSAEESMASAI